MEIRKYNESDHDGLLHLLMDEGPEWKEMYLEASAKPYHLLCLESLTFIAIEEGVIIGYARAFVDGHIATYVSELLVDKGCRGRGIGQALLGKIGQVHPEKPTYVMSDVDLYYEKIGLKKIGSIYQL